MQKRDMSHEAVKRADRPDGKKRGLLYRLLLGDATYEPKKTTVGRRDRELLILILLLLTVGSVMVFSASRAYAETHFGDADYFIRLQLLFAGIGVAMMLFTSHISPDFFRKYARIGYLITMLLLYCVPLFGSSAGGAKRWLRLGPFSFQPSELGKTMLILVFAFYFSVCSDRVLDHKKRGQAFLYGVLFPALMLLGYIVPIVLQKHLSCIIILGILTAVMMCVGGSDLKRILLFGIPAVAGVGAFAWFTEYTRRRILIWLSPELYPTEGGWQTLQGLMAIGSGGFFGLGLGNSRLKYSYVSEPQNDFIFTITCEELGFIGAALILLLFVLFVRRGFLIGLRNPDPFRRLCAIGITAKVAVQVLLNLLVITNLLPNTGISLPFFSYGGSSLVMLLTEMGILLSISRSASLGGR